MEDVRQEFLADAVSKLEDLKSKLKHDQFSEEFEKEIFRRLHTLKGTSQTFNLNVSAKLAHELENLLQAARDGKISADKNFQGLLATGINLLLQTFQNSKDKNEIIFPTEFINKIHELIPDSSTSETENLSEIVPPEFLNQFSAQEKEALSTAVSRGNFLYIIEVGFDFSDFDEQFKKLRQNLIEHGEIIANFPSPKYAAENKIGFQIFLASLKDKQSILETIQPFGANLIFQNSENDFANSLKGVLAQAVLTGEKTALKLSKQIEFETSADEIEFSPQQLKLISEILLHLVRNAVDHAIETLGKIKIEIKNQENALSLRVTDDGRGIDTKKIRNKAIAKNLISADEILTNDDLLKLIFDSGFSTSTQVSEISGRGVGLDVVADAVKKSNGEISVKSELNKGTTFEIFIPK